MIEPVSTGLAIAGVAPLAADAIDAARGRNEVKNFFTELRRRLIADGRIPYDKREWVADRVVGRSNPFRAPVTGLQVDPHFLGCVMRLLDDGDRTAFDDMKTVLEHALVLNEPDVDTGQIIEVVLDVVDRTLGPAQASDREAIHHESRRLRSNFSESRLEGREQHSDLVARHERSDERVEALTDEVRTFREEMRQSQLVEVRTEPVFIDIAWAPDSVQRALAELGRIAPAELQWLTDQFAHGSHAQVAHELTQRPPSTAASGPPQLWICVARFAERAGAWDAAIAAWLEAAERADGADRVSGMVNAAIAAHVKGDGSRYESLMEEAVRLDGDHPRVQLELAGRADPDALLAALERVKFDADDYQAILESHRALAYLKLGDFDAAERHVRLAEGKRPELLQVRSMRVNLTVERQREALVKGERPDVHTANESANEALSIRERLLEQARSEESSRMLMLASDATMLAGDVTAARSILENARESELSATGGREVIASAASRIGAHRLVLTLLESPADDHQRRERATSLAAVGTDPQAREAIKELDRLVSSDGELGESAALNRLLVTLIRPGTSWSDEAERRLAGTTHKRVAVSLKANWLGRRQRYDDVDVLLKPYEDQSWALEARLEALQGHPEDSVRKAAAERMLLEAPDPDVRFTCGVTLYQAGDQLRGLAEAKQVARDRAAELYVRTEAYRFLVTKEIENERGQNAVDLLTEWSEIEPHSKALSALWVPAAARLNRNP